MSVFQSGKPVKSLLAEYIDGGPGCIRDDCDVRVESVGLKVLNSDINLNEEKVNRCLSCGKTWTDTFKNGLT